MIIYRLIFPIFLFVRSEFAEKVYDQCSKFLNFDGTSLIKCPSEKSYDDYIECYSLMDKQYFENMDSELMYWCWSRHDNNEDILKNLTISAGSYDNSKFNDIINRPFTAKFYSNGSHIICQDNEKWGRRINPYTGTYVYCPTSTGIPAAYFRYNRNSKL